MKNKYGFNDLEESLEASNYFEPTDNGFEGKRGEEVRFHDLYAAFIGDIFYSYQASDLEREIEEETSIDFSDLEEENLEPTMGQNSEDQGLDSTDPALKALRAATSRRSSHEFVIGD